MKLTANKGSNFFKRWGWLRYPSVPYTRTTLTVKFRLDQSWFEYPLCAPKNWGFKTPPLGKFNYHEGGLNWGGGVTSDGRIFIHPRYYEPISSGTYKLHELSQYKIELFPDKTYVIKIQTFPTLKWWMNGKLIHEVDTSVPSTWRATWFLGRSGTDNNYPNDAGSQKQAAARKIILYSDTP